MIDNTTVHLEQVIRTDEGEMSNHLCQLVRNPVEETLNQILDAQANELYRAENQERTEQRKDQRRGFYQSQLDINAGRVRLTITKLRQKN